MHIIYTYRSQEYIEKLSHMLADGRLVAVECWWCSEREKEREKERVVVVVWWRWWCCHNCRYIYCRFRCDRLTVRARSKKTAHWDSRDVSNRDDYRHNNDIGQLTNCVQFICTANSDSNDAAKGQLSGLFYRVTGLKIVPLKARQIKLIGEKRCTL